MRIGILGPLEVRDTGGQLPLGGRQQRAVLAMLALQANRVVTIDELLEGIWGDRATDGSVNVLQVYVSRLRKLGGDAGIPIHRHGPGYTLQVDRHSLDLLAFRDLVDQARRTRTVSEQEAARQLREALDLWRSAPLLEFAGLPFASAEAAGLEQERLAARSNRIAADLALGRSADLIPELETLVVEHPMDEELHAQLALAQYRAGRQADALGVIRRIRTRLAEELGVDPGRPLQDLEQAVLAHDPGLAGRRDVDSRLPTPAPSPENSRPVHTVQRPVAWHVPARNPHFTGRDALLKGIFQRLSGQPDTVAVETVYGLGGVGKTHLAIEFAHRFASAYSVVWWINAEEPTFIPAQFARLNQQLGLPARASAEDMIAQVLTHLGRTGDWLLIFDNAARVADVATYRPFGAGHILVTSRSPLWGEIGRRTQVDVLDRSESMAFLRSRMHGLTDDVAGKLAAELGDLPLAMAQAAAYLEETDIDPLEYLDQFSRRRTAFLARGDVLGYEGRLDTAWDLSLQRLATSCPQALSLLEHSAFMASEPIPVEIFAARADLLADPNAPESDPLDVVEAAVGAAAGLSLVRRQSASFQVHRLVQAVIRGQLTESDRTRIAAETVELLAQALPADPNDPETWAAYRRLAPHVFALGAIADQLPTARRMLLDTTVYLNGTAPPRWSAHLSRRVLDRWRSALGEDHPDTLAMATFVVHSSIWACDPRGACELGQRSLPVARRTLGEDHPLTLTLAGYLAVALSWLADADNSGDLAFDTLARAQAAFPPEDPDLVRISTWVTLALAWIGDPAATGQARTSFETARRVFGPDHPTTLLAADLVIFGLLTEGDVESIRELGEDTLARSRVVLGDRHLITLGSAALLALGLVWGGDLDRAADLERELMSEVGVGFGPEHLITLTLAAAAASIRAASPDTNDLSGVPELDIALRMPGPDHTITLALATAAAELARRAGRPDAAAMANSATERARHRLGSGHPLARGLPPARIPAAGASPPAGQALSAIPLIGSR